MAAPRRPAAPLAWRALAALAGLLMLAMLASAARAQDVQPIPALSARVVDLAAVLSPAQRSALESKLAGFEAQAGPQIVVLLLASTQPEDIAAYAQRVGDAWKIGRREVGDGLLIVVARDDRRIRIEVAKALEGAVPDLAARQIIDRQISPAFKKGDYAGGLNAGVDAVMARVRGEHLPAPTAREGGSGRFGDAGLLGALGVGWQELGLFFFVAVPVAGAVLTGLMGRKLGSLATAGATGGLAWLITTSLLIAGLAGLATLLLVGVMGLGSAGRHSGRGGRGGDFPIVWGGGGGGGGSSSGGGDGFSSGGGGDFGGGGASGDW